jgi:hypothetical protein
MSFTWKPRLVNTPTPIMSAMTIAVAVAVDTIAGLELPLLAGVIGCCHVCVCLSLRALCVPTQAKGLPNEKNRVARTLSRPPKRPQNGRTYDVTTPDTSRKCPLPKLVKHSRNLCHEPWKQRALVREYNTS